MNSNVEHPAHYNMYPVEVIDIIKYTGFCIGNVIKYVLRAPYKGKAEEDLDKALKYLEWEREVSSRPIAYAGDRNLRALIQYFDTTPSNSATEKEILSFLRGCYNYLQTCTNQYHLDTIKKSILEMKVLMTTE